MICAGQPDTEELAAEVTSLVTGLRETRSGVIWLTGMLPRPEVIQLLTHATVFVCPSLYEPLGIVNLEAMACGTAVVASRVGGHPRSGWVDGETGLLVPMGDPGALAAAVNSLVADPERAAAMGLDGRARAVADFDWGSIAEQTVALYESPGRPAGVKPPPQGQNPPAWLRYIAMRRDRIVAYRGGHDGTVQHAGPRRPSHRSSGYRTRTVTRSCSGCRWPSPRAGWTTASFDQRTRGR